MNMFEEARSIKGMIEMLGATQDELAKKLGVSQSYVANKIRLLGLGEKGERAVIEGGLSERHARAVLRLEDEESRLLALERITDGGMTVAQAEALVDLLHEAKAPERIGRAQKLRATETFKDNLSRSVGSLVSLGIDAKMTVGLYGKRTCITVAIEED